MEELNHKQFMEIAFEEAVSALGVDEVPVGAVVVRLGEIVAKAHDEKEGRGDPTAHAEVLALRRAAGVLGTWRLVGCDLYCTLEPCAMCVGAMLQARIARLVYGAKNAKCGAVETHAKLLEIPAWNHKIKVVSGVMSEQCAELLSRYFEKKRS
jgi:tRNA(adenine34) deaminase